MTFSRLVVTLLALAAGSAAPPQDAGHLRYEGAVSIAPDSSTLQASWTITVPRRAVTGDSLVFVLNHLMHITRAGGNDVAEVVQRPDGDLTRIVVRFQPAADPRSIRFELEYNGQFRTTSDSINSLGPQWVELSLDSFWQPVVEGLGESLTSMVVIELPRGWRIATGGTTIKQSSSVTARNDVLLPDIPFAASPAFHAATAGANQVFYVDAPESTVAKTLKTTDACAKYLTGLFGPAHPLPPMRVVIAPRTGPGYARKNYIVINAASSGDSVAFARFLCHEEAHFWASGAVASGPDNWLNEGVAEYLAGRAVGALYGANAHQAMVAEWRTRGAGPSAVWTDTSTRRPSRAVAYFKAPSVLDQLEARIGTGAIDTLLVGFLTSPSHTTPELLARLRALRGSATAEWLRDELTR